MRRTLIAAAVLGPLAAHAPAQDLFVFELSETGNPSNSLTTGGSSLPELANDFADLEGAFTPFDGLAFSASLDYAGVADAIAFTYDPTGGAGGGELLTITNLEGYGAVAPFDSANGSLGDQLEDFFLKDNPDALSQFLRAVSRQSLIAITDGNPSAATARSAQYSYEWFGLNADQSPTSVELFNDFTVRDHRRQVDAARAEAEATGEEPQVPQFPAHEASSPWRWRAHLGGSTIDAGDYSGYGLDFWLGTEAVLNEHLSIHIGGAFAYTDIEGANAFKGGVHFDVPVRIVIPAPGDQVGWTWQVTPGVAAEGVGSFDYAAGGAILSAGVVNRVTADLPQGWSITAAQSIGYFDGQNLHFGDYEFDPGVSQSILKLGGKVSKRIGDKAFVYAGATWSDFLEDAAVDDWWTPTAGLGFRFRNGGVISVGYQGNFADDLTTTGGRIDISLPF